MRKVDLSCGLIAVVALALAAIPASATSNAMGDKGMVMTMMDTDGDHTLSMNEVLKAAARKFKAMDMDHDGTLDSAEMVGIMTHQNMVGADRDHDGTLDENEYLALTRTMFRAADKDHDGTLDAEELSTPAGVALVALLDYCK